MPTKITDLDISPEELKKQCTVQTTQELLQTDVAERIAKRFAESEDEAMIYKPSVILQDFEKFKNLKDGELLDKETSQRLLLVCDLPEHKEFVNKLIAMNQDVFNSIDDENNEHPLCDADGKYQ